MKKKQSWINNQRGVVSLVVTLMLITVMAIIVLAFSGFTRREERQAVDRQLSTEAFYAAESGVNDAINVLRNTPQGTGYLVNEKDDCEDPSDATFNPDLDGTENVKYTCLLIDPSPTSLEYGNISKGESKTIPVERTPAGNLQEISIYWHDPQATGSSFSSCPTAITPPSSLPAAWPGSNCDAGMLRVEVVPVGTSFTTASLESNAMVLFVKPGGGSVYSPNYIPNATTSMNSGAMAATRCESTLSATQPKYCKIMIRNLNLNRVYLRLTPLYRSATVTVCSRDCTGTAAELVGAQATIDSTGRASDILRRIQVRVGISGLDGPFPNFAIESGDSICKQMTIVPPATVSNGGGCSLP